MYCGDCQQSVFSTENQRKVIKMAKTAKKAAKKAAKKPAKKSVKKVAKKKTAKKK
jgi:hypothetical protein